jgi:hypothetical protein
VGGDPLELSMWSSLDVTPTPTTRPPITPGPSPTPTRTITPVAAR